MSTKISAVEQVMNTEKELQLFLYFIEPFSGFKIGFVFGPDFLPDQNSPDPEDGFTENDQNRR